MATVKRTNPGDAANIFVRCLLSDMSDLLGGFSQEDLEQTVRYFDYKCPYTGQDISVEYKTKKWVLDHLIPHNRESCGLNLFGNIIVTTREINARKAAKSFEDFIRNNTEGTTEEKESRIKKIRNFQDYSRYFEKIKNIDEIKQMCKDEYDFVQNRLKEKISEYQKILGVGGSSSCINKSNSTKDKMPNAKKDVTPLPAKVLPDETVTIKGERFRLYRRNDESVQDFVRKTFEQLLLNSAISDAELKRLHDAEYCKKYFGLQFALFVDTERERTISDHDRYYAKKTAGKFFLCNDWWKQHTHIYDEKLAEWLRQIAD